MRDITVTVTEEVACALIELSGAEQEQTIPRIAAQEWVFPDGAKFWMIEEALTYALPFIAENADVV